VNRAAINPSTVFLFDVDNTLLDNDRVADDLKRYLTKKVGEDCQQRYWEIFEQLRTELGYADYLGALQRYRLERPHDPKLLAVSRFMINYPFAKRLYRKSLDVVKYARRLGRAKHEMLSYSSYDFAVIDDDLERAGREVQAIALGSRNRVSRNEERIREILKSFGG